MEMYRIKETETTIFVPCKQCNEKGVVDKSCNKCGGKGIHKKTIKVWKVLSKPIQIEKISRSEKDLFYNDTLITEKGELRYWESSCDYYAEHDKLIHFNIKDAQNECNERNKDIEPLLKVLIKNRIINL